MVVTIDFVDSQEEIECFDFRIGEGRLILSDERGRTLYVANVDRWLSFYVDYEEGE